MAREESSLAFFIIAALLTLTTSGHQLHKLAPTSVCLSTASHQNATGHWIVKTTITRKGVRASTAPERAAGWWTCDLEVSKLLLNNQPSLKTTIVITVPPTPARDDYTLYNGVGYYKLHKTPEVWAKAKKICEEEGAHLAIVNSKEEEDVIRRIVSPHVQPNDDVFIGFHDLYNEGEYLTVLGEPLSSTGYINWGSGQPNNWNDGQDCGTVLGTGEINDINCDGKYFFLCEIPL